MAVLTEPERRHVWAELQRLWSRKRSPCGIVKDDLFAAVAAADDALEAWVATYNAALPQPARGVLNQEMKGEILMLVIRMRNGDPPG